MAIIDCNNVSIRYITGDFKSIGLKEYVMRKLTRNFHVKEFWADKNRHFSSKKVTCSALSDPTVPERVLC